MIGSTLSHFRVTALLGEGGMGTVYRAEDTTLDRQVAIKVLPDEQKAVLGRPMSEATCWSVHVTRTGLNARG